MENMETAQQFCLRWNNHSTNLVSMFDEQLQNEAFTDVTLVCEGGEHLRCHKMVLAACSTYFQNVFVNYPCKHPLVVLKDIKPREMRAILTYMYHGQVNVSQDQLPNFMKVANALKVKGLIEGSSDSVVSGPGIANHHNHDEDRMDPSPTGLEHSHVHSSSSSASPPHSTSSMYKYKNPYMYSANKAAAAFRERERDRANETNRLNLPLWAIPGIPLPSQGVNTTSAVTSNVHQSAAAMLSSCYEAADMSPLKRKKLSSMLMNRDTPILRNVLGQGQSQADSSQPVSLVCHPDSRDQNSNGADERLHKRLKNEPTEDAQSPYTDFSVMNEEDDKSKLAIPSSSPQSYNSKDLQRVTSGIATYVPSQKPEWKRYKQYTRDDILSAIEAVRNGMSALQAARKYSVPSRTLYDKVKKLGITTSRPFKRGSNGSSASFPYGLSGTGSPYSGHLSENDDAPTNNNTSLLEATFLQHAFEGRGGDEREALTAMAMAAAAAQAAAAGRHSNNSPPNRGHTSSPSPSPTLLKYMRHNRNSLTPSPVPGSDHQHSETNGSSERDRDEDDCDQVEDLSIGRNKQQSQESRVIMPPMSNQVSTIMKKEELLKDMIKQEARMEIKIEDRGE